MPQLGTVYRRLSQQGPRGKGAIKKVVAVVVVVVKCCSRRAAVERMKKLQEPNQPTPSPFHPWRAEQSVCIFFSGFPGWRDKYLDACPGTFSPNWILSPLLRGVSCRLICMSPVIFRAWAELTEIERQTLNRNFLAAAAICI